MVDREGRARALKILARSLCKDLAARGFDERDVIALAGELVGEVTARIAADRVGSDPRSTAAALSDEPRRRRA